MIKKSIVIFLAKYGFNEVEYLQTRRIIEQSGITIFVASDNTGLCTGSKGLKVCAEISLFNINSNNFNGIVLIGGSGIKNYWNNKSLHNILHKFSDQAKTIGAICAAPVTLAKAGLLQSTACTCHPDDKSTLIESGVEHKDSPVIVSNNFVTARSEENTVDFAKTVLAAIAM